MSLTIRQAGPEDAATIHRHIVSLAEYEKEPDKVEVTVPDIVRDGFGESPRFEVLLADWDGEPAGFALYFTTWSTWRGRPGLYLEDLFVEPRFRRRGIGEALLRRLAETVRGRGYGRLEWACLDWNQLAIGFYERLGARAMRDWIPFRVDGEALARLADGRAR